ncbi:MAG: RagB/SusD family nutrient uptake outer membrane protein, partial [Flavisolibacter sp.]|nr:RagB/SusD family nutrient uptake outer membrane protein [Flavisolibacter sp.]
MRTLLKYSIVYFIILSLFSCKKEWLERRSETTLTNEQVMNDPNLIVGLLANLYDRLPTDASLTTRWQQHTAYDDAVWSGGGNAGDVERLNIVTYATNRWALWDFQPTTSNNLTTQGFIRDVNLALESMEKFGTNLTDAQKKQFNAEFRFLRAYDYFEMVKRMGGVPIITTQLLVEDKNDVASVRRPRNKESEVYDFIAGECDAIKDFIGNGTSTTRANKYAVLALKCRAMLYAGSLAKYNNLVTPNITLPGGEVGIPASKANEYYQKALDAAKEIIAGPYSLYKGNPNPGENFY